MVEEAGVHVHKPWPTSRPNPYQREQGLSLFQPVVVFHYSPIQGQSVCSRSWRLISICGKERCKREGGTNHTFKRFSLCPLSLRVTLLSTPYPNLEQTPDIKHFAFTDKLAPVQSTPKNYLEDKKTPNHRCGPGSKIWYLVCVSIWYLLILHAKAQHSA